MKKLTKISIIAVAVLMVVLVVILSMTGNNSNSQAYSASSNTNTYSGSTPTAGLVIKNDGTKDYQEVTFHVEGASYVLEPSVLKKGVPVKLIADMNRMPGCSKAVVIKDFGVSEYMRPGDYTIEFTPDKVGTFKIACSMNMYIGTFTVTEDGLAPTGIQATQATEIKTQVASTPKSTCGMGGSGGCGCGGA